MTRDTRREGGGGGIAHLLRALPALLTLLLVAAPAAALDTLYLVRHAEKTAGWPQEQDALQPLSPAGTVRAEFLASRLESAGIKAIYASPTTRTLATGLPLALRTGVRLTAVEDSIKADRMGAFLAGLRTAHPNDRAVLIVGHSNTVPRLLTLLGAVPECFARLGIVRKGDELLIEGHDGLWRVELGRQGCEAVTREQSRE